ncbi:MAG: protein translocase subunit SecD [Chloroflexi bacterium]|nr:MAG: protein translocase subunit SecD [Chloroflexota bacterium]
MANPDPRARPPGVLPVRGRSGLRLPVREPPADDRQRPGPAAQLRRLAAVLPQGPRPLGRDPADAADDQLPARRGPGDRAAADDRHPAGAQQARGPAGGGQRLPEAAQRPRHQRTTGPAGRSGPDRRRAGRRLLGARHRHPRPVGPPRLPNGGTAWVVNFQFNGAGAGIFGQLSTTAYGACGSGGTGSCPQSHITNWLDLTQDDINNWNTRAAQIYQPFNSGGKLLSDPYIQQPITGGNGFIQGNFSQQSAQDLATSLNSGALPVQLTIIQSSDVGATLGADSVKRSLAAGLLGLVIIVIFMLAFYRLPGLLASLALLFYAGVLLAIFKAWPVTLTLAGLAGVILSVGMAVDANVLIFERFKEEMRAGRTIGAAVEAAVRRAWPAIRDSNTATLITSLILFFASTGSVKGFALTLAIGVAISLVSSIIVTHNLLAIVLNFGWARTSSMLGVARGRA